MYAYGHNYWEGAAPEKPVMTIDNYDDYYDFYSYYYNAEPKPATTVRDLILLIIFSATSLNIV